MCPYYTVLNMCFCTNEIEINRRCISGQDAVCRTNLFQVTKYFLLQGNFLYYSLYHHIYIPKLFIIDNSRDQRQFYQRRRKNTIHGLKKMPQHVIFPHPLVWNNKKLWLKIKKLQCLIEFYIETWK